jgi:hypothetical protein
MIYVNKSCNLIFLCSQKSDELPVRSGWVAIFCHYVLTGIYEPQTEKIRYMYIILGLHKETVALIRSVPITLRKLCWTTATLALGGSRCDPLRITPNNFLKCCFTVFKDRFPNQGNTIRFLLHNFLCRLLIKQVLAETSAQPRLPTFESSGQYITLCNNEKDWRSFDLDAKVLDVYRLDDKILVRLLVQARI